MLYFPPASQRSSVTWIVRRCRSMGSGRESEGPKHQRKRFASWRVIFMGSSAWRFEELEDPRSLNISTTPPLGLVHGQTKPSERPFPAVRPALTTPPCQRSPTERRSSETAPGSGCLEVAWLPRPGPHSWPEHRRDVPLIPRGQRASPTSGLDKTARGGIPSHPNDPLKTPPGRAVGDVSMTSGSRIFSAPLFCAYFWQ